VTLPAFAAERRRPLSIDRGLSPPRAALSMASPAHAAAGGVQQQTRRMPLLMLIEGTDRLTDGRTLDCFIDPLFYRYPHTTLAA